MAVHPLHVVPSQCSTVPERPHTHCVPEGVVVAPSRSLPCGRGLSQHQPSLEQMGVIGSV